MAGASSQRTSPIVRCRSCSTQNSIYLTRPAVIARRRPNCYAAWRLVRRAAVLSKERAQAADAIRAPTGYESLQKFRIWIEAGLDALIWAVSLGSGSMLRIGDVGHAVDLRLGAVIAVAIAVQWVVGIVTQLYRVHWQVGSFEQMRALAITMVLTTIVVTVFDVARPDHVVSYGAVVAGGFIALSLAGAVRSAWRLNWERHLRPAAGARRAIVFGAGEGGTSLVNMMVNRRDTPYIPVALLDDDPAKRRRRVRHLTVAGGREAIAAVAARSEADTVIIAIPSATSDLIREVADMARPANLEVRVLPPPSELLFSPLKPSDIRPVTPADLLGRHVVDTHVQEVAEYLHSRRVLVTGAGGSIGSELCRQIQRFEPAQLVMLDRDEAGLHAVQLSLQGRALLDDRSIVLCNIRDRAAVEAAFAEHKPEVVFHAAALKHLPLLEMWPGEAVKTNVFGTQNVLDAAMVHGVERFVNISTDKAARPISVLGYTKRIAERLTAETNHRAAGTYLSVRFGNVLASSGSVLVTFGRQIDNGGPITVTHPDVTRYFMTVEEAVELVIQAGAIGRSSEVLVLDMGEPVRIAEVAERLIAAAGAEIEIVYTGLRTGEKLHEDLFGDGELDVRPVHPLISHAHVSGLDSACLNGLDDLSDTVLKAKLRSICTNTAVASTQKERSISGG